MSHRRGRVNFVYWNSGAGTAHDVSLMEGILSGVGVRVRHIVTRDRGCRLERMVKAARQIRTALWPSGMQIHFEQIHREQLRHGRYNFILPNPEFTDPEIFRKLSRQPVVLCKTRHAQGLFSPLLGSALYIGFTSRDRVRPAIKKDYRQFLHVGGLSDFKGTVRLAQLWATQPGWPRLTIVRASHDRDGKPRAPLPTGPNIRLINEWIGDEALRELQNQCGVHICPSEAEGFGHYIMEAMSCGSAVITTDAAPMNELVVARNGFLVAGRAGRPSFMSDTCLFETEAMKHTIETVASLPAETLAQMGQSGRRRYLRMDADFRGRIKILLHQYLREPRSTRGIPLAGCLTKARTSVYPISGGRS